MGLNTNCRLCVVVREPTMDRVLAALPRAAAWGDAVEVRADYIQDLDVKELFRHKPLPILFTLRAAHEGGEYRGPETTRIETILEAARSGADWVDIEFSSPWKTVLQEIPREQVVLSYHNFSETPADLQSILDRMAAAGPGMLKVATRARRLTDNLAVRSLLFNAAARGWSVCALAMGSPGVPSRVLGGAWGSALAFASMPDGQPSADGQLSARDMREIYRWREIGAATQVYGVIGKPLGHSLSPLIHNAAFSARGADAVYLPLEPADIDDFVAFSREIPLSGASVTIPYKRDIAALVGSTGMEADRIGAINTLVRRGEAWHGANTDAEGFVRPLLDRVDIVAKRVVVLGAGGAAHAAVYALRSHGADVCVVARDREKAARLAERFEVAHAAWDQLRYLVWHVLVNTTPVGMYPRVQESPVPAEHLNGGWVYDLIYNPARTRLLQDASARGCRTIGGLEMFLAQAGEQQRLWFGSGPPVEVMRRKLEDALQSPPLSD
jgi:3-dehydroquinate dehydratase / shikimate dehydrogenase